MQAIIKSVRKIFFENILTKTLDENNLWHVALVLAAKAKCQLIGEAIIKQAPRAQCPDNNRTLRFS
jgi:hypothetical protein